MCTNYSSTQTVTQTQEEHNNYVSGGGWGKPDVGSSSTIVNTLASWTAHSYPVTT